MYSDFSCLGLFRAANEIVNKASEFTHRNRDRYFSDRLVAPLDAFDCCMATRQIIRRDRRHILKMRDHINHRSFIFGQLSAKARPAAQP